jgi:prepilin-type N-terminal cleavage/methylation domain-containing protein
MSNRQPQKRAGYTLTELLIVIMIALLLMVVSLPTIKSVMEDARPREASRILNTTIFTAKARAAQTGNPAGIEFVYDPNTVMGAARCTQMYMCEMPAIYAGDIADARVVVTIPSNGTPWTLDFQGGASSLPTLLDSTNQFWIRINHRGPWYSVDGSSGYRIQPTTPRPPISDTSGYSFQIRRPPVRVGNPVEMPKSTAIDMTYSGMGPDGTDFNSTGTYLRVLFSPSGNVESYTLSGANPTAATGTLHFLIGLAAKMSPQANAFDMEQSNLVDANALWVSVGRATGVVTTNENNATQPTGNAGTLADREAYLAICRQYATNREQKGGR